ncbi:hypothetical protein BC830DRAFT_1076640 [Chytriomyces sp. MP71]|nr:hypothetical protein BC830DRAFT_1076640 [Chytriomyces sp. MP71]
MVLTPILAVWVVSIVHIAMALPTVKVMLVPILADLIKCEPDTRPSASSDNMTYEQTVTQKFLDDHFTPKYGIQAVVYMSSTLVTTQYASEVQLYLSSNDSSIDIFMMDVVWPAGFADHLVDLTPYITPDISNQHNPTIWNNGVVNGRHVAVPTFADYGVFYYRDDLLAKYGFNSPPATWDEMEFMATTVMAGEPNMIGYLAQFNAYEGLTCNLMEWLAGNDAGSILLPNQTLTFDNPRTVQILDRVKRWFLTGITPKYALTFEEKDTLTAFSTGNVLFMRSWPNAGSVLKAASVPFSFKVTGNPGATNETKFAAALGGWHMGLTKATHNATAAAQVILYMASAEFQKFRLETVGVLPTIMALYEASRITTAINGLWDAFSQTLYTTINSFLSLAIDLPTMMEIIPLQIEQTIGTYPAVVASHATFLGYTTGLGIAFMIVGAIGILVSIGLGILTVVHASNPVIKAASPDFLCLILFGVSIGFSSLFVYAGPPSTATCMAQPFLLTIGIFSGWKNGLINTEGLKSYMLSFYVSFYVALNIAVLIIWVVVDPLSKAAVFQTPDIAYLVCTSQYSRTFNGVLLGMNGLILVFGSWLAYKTRNVDETYRESFWIAIIMYNTLIWGAIACSLVFVESLGNELHFAVRGVSVSMCGFGIQGLLFFPKLNFMKVWFLRQEIFTQSVGKPETILSQPESSTVSKQEVSDFKGVDGFKLAFRFGSSTLFMSNWMEVKMNLVGDRHRYVVALARVSRKKKVGKIYGFSLPAKECVAVLRSYEDSEGILTVLIKLPDGQLFELASNKPAHLNQVVEKLKTKQNLFQETL